VDQAADFAVSRPLVGVGVLVRRQDDLLLVRRHGAHGAGTWSPPGGYLDFGEHPTDCAVREVREETRIEVSEPRFLGVTNDLFEPEAMHFVTLWFQAPYAGGEAELGAPEEAAEVKWFPDDHLPTPLFPPFRRFLGGELLQA
jgi:8-oxo-dGTP diphosphatase